MSRILENLYPQDIWKYFEDICQIPRASKKEEKIAKYLMEFAKSKNLSAAMDAAGNVVIVKAATKGYENHKTIVLQSHMDMVCEKNSDIVHDFDKDPIQPWIDGDWVKARGTTLGADDGIGIAAQLAVLASNELQHGPVECLFTVDEETGLTGAAALEPGFIKGETLLNLDSEDEGELFIGCAGGIDTVATTSYKKKQVPVNYAGYKVMVSGLKGGHSGDDIHRGLGNSNKILNRFLWNSSKEFKIRITEINGGNLRNAIPREAWAQIIVPLKKETAFLEALKAFTTDIKNELSITEPEMVIRCESTQLPEFVINKNAQRRLLNVLYACPHGVMAMSQRMPGMVETSTNLASVKFIGDNQIVVTTSQRSDSESAKKDIAMMVESVFVLAEFDVKHGEGYPGWTPNPTSEILKSTVQAYTQLFGNTPIVRSIHAGLECGLFLEKYPNLDMVSFGPTLRGVHSPDEKINIATVEKFWKLLVEILRIH
jgi:dipeptidase D